MMCPDCGKLRHRGECKRILVVDPPSGWQYGFPKEFDFKGSILLPGAYEEALEKWFRDNGYPQKLIDQGMLKHCRYWYADVERK